MEKLSISRTNVAGSPEFCMGIRRECLMINMTAFIWVTGSVNKAHVTEASKPIIWLHNTMESKNTGILNPFSEQFNSFNNGTV